MQKGVTKFSLIGDSKDLSEKFILFEVLPGNKIYNNVEHSLKNMF